MPFIVRAGRTGDRHIARIFDSLKTAKEVASAFEFMLFDDSVDMDWGMNRRTSRVCRESREKDVWVEIERVPSPEPINRNTNTLV